MVDRYVEQHLAETVAIAQQVDREAVTRIIGEIKNLRDRGGRLFFLGVGGSAANCSHAVNDFRKIVGIEAYTPTDNVAELTARINDDGWDKALAGWLKASHLGAKDLVFVFSVGGGSAEKNVSPNLVVALDFARSVGAGVVGIVGRDGGYTAKVANACVVIPVVNPEAVTPHTEAFQGVIWHLVVSHPLLKAAATKWEAVAQQAQAGK